MTSLLVKKNIVIVGATGAVGREALSILAQRAVPADRLKVAASPGSVGKLLPYADSSLVLHAVDETFFHQANIALFCATSSIARQWASHAANSGCLVVDNSSAFRAEPDVPLVVPEVNARAIGDSRLIANPNCSTIILLLALEPLRNRFGVERIVVSTYQAVSGAGAAAMDELRELSRVVLKGGEPSPRVFKESCAFNVFSHNSSVDLDTGLNGEEAKMITESRKIWNNPTLSITPTCVRVGVMRAHTQSITVTLARPATEVQVRAALQSAPGLRLVDDRVNNSFPTPLKATGGDDVLVGRIRPDPGIAMDSEGRSCSWCLLISADQLRKGAALNAVQVAEAAMLSHR